MSAKTTIGVRAVLALVAASLVIEVEDATAGPLGPTPYLQASDSPLADLAFSTFHLEDFEDGALNTPGASASNGLVVIPSRITDSVDADDGSIDGSGEEWHSFHEQFGTTGISFVFDAVPLGGLPTHAGVVWTGGLGPTTFEAFDGFGASLGMIGPVLVSDGQEFPSGTAEDHFFGWSDPAGIGRIFITNTMGGIEVDHLQYGILGPPPPAPPSAVPLPASAGLLVGGLALLGLAAARRHRPVS